MYESGSFPDKLLKTLTKEKKSMPKKTTQEYSIGNSSVLYLAFELSNKVWKLGFSNGLGQKVRIRSIEAGNLDAVKREIESAKKRFRLPEKTQVLSCYEAG